MSCERYEKYISMYIENELSNQEQQELQLHLQDCESCRAQLEAIQFMKGLVKQENITIKPQNKIKNRIYSKIYRDLLILFAGLAIIVSMVAVSGGFAQMLLFDKISIGIKIFFFSGILLLIIGLIILMYDVFVDMFKITFKR